MKLMKSAGCWMMSLGIESGDPELLAQHRQMFAFEPPHFGPDASIGGMVASGLAGPRRGFAGSIRDYLLGAKMIDGRG